MSDIGYPNSSAIGNAKQYKYKLCTWEIYEVLIHKVYKPTTFKACKSNGTLYTCVWLQGLYSLSGETSYRPPNLLRSRNREIECYNDRIPLEFDRHLDSAAAEMPVKFQSD